MKLIKMSLYLGLRDKFKNIPFRNTHTQKKL